ncbi:MAG TPA: response regulator, partial [Paenibacillus sp.]|nr:response regulator [Paenibacillus sp.]
MNVLLVDDEQFALDYLEESVDWHAFGIEQAYTADSVDGALEIIGQAPISLIVTDIRMPEKSGLDLLKTVHERFPSIKVVLLTGYAEFEYAKRALQHGASDYLLKPVTSADVEDCLRKVLAKIEDEANRQKDLIAAKDMLRYGAGRMREQLLLELLLEKRYPAEELAAHLAALRLPFAPDDPSVLALLRIETNLEESSREDWELFRYAVVNIAEELFQEPSGAPRGLWFCKDPHRYVVLLTTASAEAEPGRIYERLDALRQAAKTFLGRTVSIVVSPPFPLRARLVETYREMLQAFWKRVGSRTDALLTPEDGTAAIEMKPLVKLYEAPTLAHYMEAGRWDEAELRLEAILSELDAPEYRTREHLTETAYHLYGCFSYLAHKQGDSFVDLASGLPLSDPGHLHTTDVIRSWAVQLMEQFRRSLPEQGGSHHHVIRQIQSYVEQHLPEDLSLTRIGEHVFLHPVYLSRLYKKETGESLSAYITRIRM